MFYRDIWEIGAAGAQLPYKQTVTGSNPVSPTINYMPRVCVAFLFRAFSSAGEHFLHTEGVIGSIPVTPTIEIVAEVICLGFFIARQSWTKTRTLWWPITLSAPRARLLRMTLPTTRTPLARKPLTMVPTSRTSPPHRLVRQ